MKKVLIAKDIHALLEKDKSFFDRTDLTVFVAATNDEALEMHRTKRVDLIIMQLDMPGMTSEQFCSLIREDTSLRAVSMIMVCDNTPAAVERSERCRANAVLLQPVHPLVVMVKAQQLLEIAARETIRVLLSVRADSLSRDESFYCRTRNISATGMLIETDTPLAPGARLSCFFYLPNAKKVQVSGKIIRTIEQTPGDEDHQYGVMFTDISPEVRKLLNDYVEFSSRKSRPQGS
jgi:CheY-like chemotaxis protein